MKLKLYLFIALLTTSLLFISFSESSENTKVITKSTDTTQNYLYRYGEHIYHRENCYKCHTLNPAKDNGLISLDGLQDKYSELWHYNHLTDPSSVTFNSKMPTFAFLADQHFNKDSIIINIKPISQNSWEQELQKTKNIKELLLKIGVEINENSEILALVYFLDNIPASNELRIIREKEKQKLAREEEVMDSLWLNAEDAITTAVNDTHSVKIGGNLFQTNCAPCHGKFGEGIAGPNLTDDYWLHGDKPLSIAKTITNGISGTWMISRRDQFTPTEIGQLVAFITSIRGNKPANAKAPQGIKE